jgi:hypothetical protein
MKAVDFDGVLRDALQRMPDEYLQCRDLRHLWHREGGYTVAGTVDGGSIVERSVVCQRCGTSKVEKHLLVEKRGKPTRMQFLGTSYRYPDGYLMPEMSRSEHPRELLRGEEFRRWSGASS